MGNPRYPDPRREGPHLAGEFLQSFLEDALTPEEVERLKAHLNAGACRICEDGLGNVSDEVLDASLVRRIERQHKVRVQAILPIEGRDFGPHEEAARRGWEAVKRMLLEKGLMKSE